MSNILLVGLAELVVHDEERSPEADAEEHCGLDDEGPSVLSAERHSLKIRDLCGNGLHKSGLKNLAQKLVRSFSFS